MKKKFFILPPLLFLITLLIFLNFNRASLNKLLSNSTQNQPVDVLIFSNDLSAQQEITITTRICPHCNATNSPKSEHCIRCGRSLRKPTKIK